MELKWSSQRSIANSKIVKSSAVWLVLVPLVAKILSSLDNVIELTIFNGVFKFSTALPFSWQLLFFSASFFTVAGLIYSLFCPDIVKLYENFTQFDSDGKTRLQINSALKKIVWDTSKGKIISSYIPIASKFFKLYTKHMVETEIKSEDNGNSLFEDVTKNEGKNSNAFYYVYSVSDIHGQNLITASLIFYIGGFICIGIIAVQNVCFVINTLS